jgi:hypothetical protein
MAIRKAFIDDDEKKDLKEGNKRQYRHDMLHTVLLPYPNHPEAAGGVFLPKIVEGFATYVKFNEDTGLPSYNNKAHGDAVNALFKKNLPDISLGRDTNTIYKGIVIQSFLLLIFKAFINETRPDLLEVSMTSQMLLDNIPILQNMGLNEEELIRLCVLYQILLVFRWCVEKGTKEKCLLAGAMLVGSTRIEVLSATVKKAGAFAASCRHVYDYINPSDKTASPLLEVWQDFDFPSPTHTTLDESPPDRPARSHSPLSSPQENSVPFPNTSFALFDEVLSPDEIEIIYLAFGDAEKTALPLDAAAAALLFLDHRPRRFPTGCRDQVGLGVEIAIVRAVSALHPDNPCADRGAGADAGADDCRDRDRHRHENRAGRGRVRQPQVLREGQ